MLCTLNWRQVLAESSCGFLRTWENRLQVYFQLDCDRTKCMNVSCIIREFYFLILLFGGFPCIFWELHGDAQPNAHQGDQYDVRKVSAQDVVVQGESEERRGSGRCHSSLNRDHRLRKAICGAERPLAGCGGRHVHEHRALQVRIRVSNAVRNRRTE